MEKIKILKKSFLFLRKNNIYYDSSLNYLDSLEPVPGFGMVQYWISGIKKKPYFFFFNFKIFFNFLFQNRLCGYK